MTVNTTSIKSGPYLGNDIADEFSYYFRVEDKTQLAVYETDPAGTPVILTVDTDYTVAGVGVDAGGIITRVAGALPTDYEWLIVADYKETQTTPFASQGGFFPDVHEAAMDKLTFLIQQNTEELSRTVQVPITSDTDPNDLIELIIQAEIDAGLSADAAEQSAIESANSASDSADSASAASASENKSQEWAENPENVPVEPDKYSALHWAAKAEQAVVGANTNKSTRQAVQTGQPLESTPATVQVCGTESGDLRSTYHTGLPDGLTGSRGALILTKDKGVDDTVLQSTMLSETRSRLYTSLTAIESETSQLAQQYLNNGVQLGSNSTLTSANLLMFNTTEDEWMPDGGHWQWNPGSGFFQAVFIGTGVVRNLQHPMDKQIAFYGLKDTSSTFDWFTGRANTTEMMRLNSTAAETELSYQAVPPTDTYINLGTSSNINKLNDVYFIFGVCGDPLPDIHPEAYGMRDVSVQWISAEAETLDVGFEPEMIIYRDLTGGDWHLLNSAAGFDKFTILNDTDAEATETLLTVSGTEITLGAHSNEIMVIAVGAEAAAPSTKIKQNTGLLRKVGTATANERRDIVPMAGGNNGGFGFGRDIIGTSGNVFISTLMGDNNNLYTTSPAGLVTDNWGVFSATGLLLSAWTGLNSSNLTQISCFGTTQKLTTDDGLVWNVNMLTGVGFTEHTGDGVAGRTLGHPFEGKVPLMSWYKNKDAADNWCVYLQTLGATKALRLNDSIAAITTTSRWNDTAPTVTQITLGSSPEVNDTGDTIASYHWFGDIQVEGASEGVAGMPGKTAFYQVSHSIGAGVAVDVRCVPALVLIKTSEVVGDWYWCNLGSGKAYTLNDISIESDSSTWFTINDTEITLYSWETKVYDIAVFSAAALSGIDDQLIQPASVADPLVVSMANGYGEDGNVDTIVKITSDTNMTITGDAGRKFIYIMDDEMFYFTDQRPEYLRNYVPHAAGNKVYDILGAKMYNASGIAELAVFRGECSLDEEGNVFDVVSYATGDVWVGDVFASLPSNISLGINVFGHTEITPLLIGTSASGKDFVSEELLEIDEDETSVTTDASPDAPYYKINLRRNF